MGRLFWKIFLGFWLALVVAAVGAGTAVWVQRLERAREAPPPDLAVGPPHRIAIDMAAATLRYGGVDALRQWMNDWQGRRPVPVFAVDGDGRDLLAREVPAGALTQAREVVARGSAGQGVRLVAAPGGESFLLFVAFSALLAWYLARPIRNLRWAFDAAAAGRLETRVSPLMGRRRDEIADLGRDFDRMAQQLQNLVSAQRRLLHDVSHELRSPLARLQAAIGLARQQPAKLDTSLERIEREAMRLDSMVGEVLALARLESGTASRMKERVDLAYIAASIAEDARFEAEALARAVRFNASGDAPVIGNADLLHRAVENIVRNAVKFTREGTTVDVRVHTTRTSAILTVTDHGPGIAAGELQKVFDPFYRGEAGSGTAGFGLGLAIAQRAVDAHGGAIRASNVPGGGLEVEVDLPLAHG
ncbi:MAG: HAMP domain-containing protein [Betaproteobacteria bacterium]|nr:MAG: HAMP domain-containing protein [Betaproteobacteria bacterium]